MRLTHKRALALLEGRRQAANYAPSSILLEQRQLRRTLPRLSASLQRVTREDVTRWLAARLTEASSTTTAHELRSLRALYRVLADEGLVSHDPTDGLELAPQDPRRLVLSEAQVEQLLAEASRVLPGRWGRGRQKRAALALRDRCALELLYGLGLRASELCRARFTELDLATGVLRVERAKRGPPAILTVPPSALPHVERYAREGRPVLLGRYGEQHSRGRLLVTEHGRVLKVSRLEDLVKRIARRARIEAHPHAFRRSVATHLARAGASLIAIQHLLGHASLRTTQAYVALDIGDLRDAIALLDRE